MKEEREGVGPPEKGAFVYAWGDEGGGRHREKGLPRSWEESPE